MASLMRGRGYVSFFMQLLSFWRSMQNCKSPVFFCTKTTALLHGLYDLWITLTLTISCSSCFTSSWRCGGILQYHSLKGSGSVRLIWCLMTSVFPISNFSMEKALWFQSRVSFTLSAFFPIHVVSPSSLSASSTFTHHSPSLRGLARSLQVRASWISPIWFGIVMCAFFTSSCISSLNCSYGRLANVSATFLISCSSVSNLGGLNTESMTLVARMQYLILVCFLRVIGMVLMFWMTIWMVLEEGVASV